jgi:LysM domain/Peptidase family M1 domain
VLPRRLPQLILLVSLLLWLVACTAVATPPSQVATFTPRPVSTEAATQRGVLSPTLTPVPLGQLPNALATYHFDITLDFVGHRAQVKQVVEVVNPGPDTWDSVLFQMPAAVQSPNFILNSITIPQGDTVVNAVYELKGYGLRVVIPGGVAPGAATTVTLQYGLNAPPIDLTTRAPDGNLGSNDHIVQFVNWYPILTPYEPSLGWVAVGAEASGPLPGDPIFTETAAYDLTITTAPNITIVSGGLVSSNNGQWRFAFKNARTVAFVAGDDFDFLTQLEGGTAITSYFLKEHAEAGKAALTTAAQALSLFDDRFGAYPYPTLAVVEDAYSASATASGVVLHTGQGYADYAGKPDSLLVATLPQALARLWWGQIVQGDSFNQPWLNEALPMYSEYLFIESFYPDLKTWYWDSRINYWKPEGLLGRPVSDFADDEDYLRNLLRRGALFMDGLRKNIGDDAFFAFINDYYRNGAYRIVTSADFFNALRRHTDSNLEGLLTDYFIGQTMPTAAPTLTPAMSETPLGPPTPTPVIHVVKAGESLTYIAGLYGVSVDALVKANNLPNPDSIYSGQKLVIPQP